MKFFHLQLLCALEQYHSFSKTATHLFLSQPALSTSLKTLETELKCHLLTRSNKGVQFTPAGKLALEKAHKILNEIALIQSIAESENTIFEDLTIAGNTLHCINLLLNLIQQLHFTNSSININLQEIDESIIIQQLKAQTIDYAILQINSLHVSQEYNSISTKYNLFPIELTKEPLVILINKHHPLASCKTISIYDLFKFPFITAHLETDHRLIEELQIRGYTYPPLEITDTFSVDQMISKNHYWAFIPKSELSRHKSNPNNPFTFLYTKDFTCECALIWFHSDTDDNYLNELQFLQILRKILSQKERAL